MKVTYDPYVDAVYIRLTPKGQDVTTHIFDNWIAVDIGENGAVVGFEILDASKSLDLGQLEKLDFVQYGPPLPLGSTPKAAAVRERKPDRKPDREPTLSASEDTNI